MNSVGCTFMCGTLSVEPAIPDDPKLSVTLLGSLKERKLLLAAKTLFP